MALGAHRSDVVRLVVRDGMALVAIGVFVGVGLSLLASRALASLLFAMNATDPVNFGGASMVLLITALIGSYLPARRASRVDPLVVLREP